jgi:hypothetical protein
MLQSTKTNVKNSQKIPNEIPAQTLFFLDFFLRLKPTFNAAIYIPTNNLF